MVDAEVEEGQKKSYFYVLSEEKDCSELEAGLLDAFNRFEEAHKTDSEIIKLHPGEEDFELARAQFGINRTPAFVLADEEGKLEKGTNPYITFNRPTFENLEKEKIFNLITDIHYLIIDEDILHVRDKIARAWLFGVFRDVWSELKDFIKISI